MKRDHHIWIVIADGVHAQFFTPDRDLTRLELDGPKEMRWATGQKLARDLKSDGPGRSFSSAQNGTRHAIEPKHDYHKLEKHKFVAALANALDRAASDEAFQTLILAAPRRSLGELRAELSARVKARIAEEIAKDLANLAPHELWERLAPAVRKAIAHAQMA